MVDEFSRLRHDIYLSHEPGDPEGYRRLARALTGDQDPLDPVLGGMAVLHAAAVASRGAAFTSHAPAGCGGAAIGLLAMLGASPYLDRYLADAFRGRREVESEVRPLIDEPGRERAAFAFAASAGLEAFSTGRTANALGPGTDAETLIDALAYAAEAGLEEIVPHVRSLLESPLPWGVRAEALSVLDDLQTADNGSPHETGSALVQSLFYGDPARMGKGGSGGVGTLVRELGGALASSAFPVYSLVCYNSRTCDYPFLPRETLAPDHVVVRMPVYLREQNPAGFLAGEHRIARAARRALRREVLRPGIVHVRFLDDASRAVGRVAAAQGIPVVTTLTPDPHRGICGPDGRIEPRRDEAARELFNRILIGDDLLSLSRGVVAIGRSAFSDSLVAYYPQLEDTRGRILAGIDEGVDTSSSHVPIRAEAMLREAPSGLVLSARRISAPAIVSVGRLGEVKGQVNLVRAWASSDLWRRFNLVLVGGDFETPSPEEREIQSRIRGEMRDGIRGRLCHVPAQPNEVVRALLAWFSGRASREIHDFYVCPSLKEEFGLSILEAMAEGLPVCAPIWGGPPRYIRHGINGFLMDTRDVWTLSRELSAVLDRAARDPAAIIRMKRLARTTVEEGYSLQTMTAEYRTFYARVSGQGDAP